MSITKNITLSKEIRDKLFSIMECDGIEATQKNIGEWFRNKIREIYKQYVEDKKIVE